MAVPALALRSPHVPGPRPPSGTMAEAAGGSHGKQRAGWNEASEAELAGPPALSAKQATPTRPRALLSHTHTHTAVSPQGEEKGVKMTGRSGPKNFPLFDSMLPGMGLDFPNWEVGIIIPTSQGVCEEGWQ